MFTFRKTVFKPPLLSFPRREQNFRKTNYYIGFYLEVYIPRIFEVSEIIPFKNGFSNSHHALNYKTRKKLHYTVGDTKLILTFRILIKSRIQWVNT